MIMTIDNNLIQSSPNLFIYYYLLKLYFTRVKTHYSQGLKNLWPSGKLTLSYTCKIQIILN
jgi:hypothetical protein